MFMSSGSLECLSSYPVLVEPVDPFILDTGSHKGWDANGKSLAGSSAAAVCKEELSMVDRYEVVMVLTYRQTTRQR